MECDCDKKVPLAPRKVETLCPVYFVTTEVEGSIASNPPAIGEFRNTRVVYKETNESVLYDSKGIPTIIKQVGDVSFDELADRPKYNGEEMTSETDIPDWTSQIGEQAEALAQETQDRIATDNVLQTAISEEASARETADTALGGRIDATLTALDTETATRQTMDTALQNRIEDVASDLADETSARQTAVSDEADARQAADTNLQSQIDAISASSDVTDVVGTKAALDAYDTSVLRPNDIIKVLQDESLSGETTYYRWTGSAFTLIGEEGPYYTKAQADALLNNKVDKVAGKQLSTEDFTTAEKTKLDELVDIKSIGSNLTLDTNGELSGTAGGLDPATTFWGQTAQNGVVSGDITLGINSTSGANYGKFVIGSKNTSSYGTSLYSTGYIVGLTVPAVHGWFEFGGNTNSIWGVISSTGYNAKNLKVYNLAAPTASTDAANKQYVDDLAISYASLNGSGAPTTATEGKYVGQLYLDTTNGEMYYLSAIDDSVTPNTYTWAQMGGGGIPTDATFWGASYDATNNVVSGDIVLPGTSYKLRPSSSSTNWIGFSGDNLPVLRGYGMVQLMVPTRSNEQTVLEFSGSTAGQRINLKGASSSQTLRISGVTDPTNAQDAATKNYVDTAVASAGAAVLANTDYQTLWQ